MRSCLKNGVLGGLALAFFHFCWIIVVALGWGQALLDFVFRIHMLEVSFRVQPFNGTYALILIAFTFSVGFVMGIVFGLLEKTLRPS